MNIKNKVSTEDIIKVLDSCYEKCKDGIPVVSKPVPELASEYLSRYKKPEKAAKEMIRRQIAKCTTSGFVTGLGGVITLPVSVPANISSVLYVQMRMVACTAYMAGLELDSDEVQTFVYACLAGVSLNEAAKKAGIKTGEKIALALIKKIPGDVIIAINKKVGFRLLTKAGETGIINLTKLVPGVGALINGGLDLVETRIIARRAYKLFFEGETDFSKEDGIFDAVSTDHYDDFED